MSFGLRRDFCADLLPHTLSSLFPPLCSLQYHSPSHFSPFISPEIVFYAPISLVYLACSHLHFLPLPLLSTITSLPVVFPILLSSTPQHLSFPLLSSSPRGFLSSLLPSPLLYCFTGILATALLSLPLPPSFLQQVSECAAV